MQDLGQSFAQGVDRGKLKPRIGDLQKRGPVCTVKIANSICKSAQRQRLDKQENKTEQKTELKTAAERA